MSDGPKWVMALIRSPCRTELFQKLEFLSRSVFRLMHALQKFFSFSELGQVRAVGFERDAVFVELLFDDASFRFGDEEDEVLPFFHDTSPAFRALGHFLLDGRV